MNDRSTMPESPFPRKVLIAGRVNVGALEHSYRKALESLGIEASVWDFPGAVNRYARLGKVGRLVHQFLPVEPWTAKANREFLTHVLDTRPDLILVFGNCRLSAGTLGQIQATLPECRLAMIWVDSLTYCFSPIIHALPMYDVVATYSRATMAPLERLGARRTAWLPLAFDPHHHPPTPKPETRAYDVSFVGNHTPEREATVRELVDAGFRVAVWGEADWVKFSRDKQALKKYFQGKTVWGAEFPRAILSAPLSLNPINAVTYPAANMRFFEILGCGGTPMSSPCPEFEDDFRDGETCFYFGRGKSVSEAVRAALADPEAMGRVAAAGHAKVLAGHTYADRARQLIRLLGWNGEPGPGARPQ